MKTPMKTTKAIFATIVFLLSANAAVAAESYGKLVGTLGMVEGDVRLDERLVKKNASVRAGSTIETKKGKATLLLGTGSVFHVASHSKMVVNEYGIQPDTKKEGGTVDLRFGRTRVLLLNKGAETKDLKIKTRTATMGVRGTEVFLDVPRDESRPVQMFTLEGKAVVQMQSAPPQSLGQNQGMSASQGQDQGGAPSMSVQEVKNEIKQSGMQVDSIKTPGDLSKKVDRQYMSDTFGVAGGIPVLNLDPIQDRLTPVTIAPRFCNAVGSVGCP